jgi:hypothetical protein
MIAITSKTIFSPRSKSIGLLLGEICMAEVKMPHKCHIGQERVYDFAGASEILLAHLKFCWRGF